MLGTIQISETAPTILMQFSMQRTSGAIQWSSSENLLKKNTAQSSIIQVLHYCLPYGVGLRALSATISTDIVGVISAD